MTRIIRRTKQILNGNRGAVLILVGFLIFVLLGFAAFAIDFGYAYVVRSQLQNAADAAALAGASVLFAANENCLSSGSPYSCCSGLKVGTCDPTTIDSDNVGGTAKAVAALNNSTINTVPVPTIEIGHYKFASARANPGVFTASATNIQMTNWSTQTFDDLNNMDGTGATGDFFINAVRATVSRTDVPRFLSRIWSTSPLTITASATAYIGFAGTMPPGTADQPIAICQQSLLLNGVYVCNTGRMLNSGSKAATHNTAAWTNFTQPCETANDKDMKDLICANGNPKTIIFGRGMGSTGGTQDNTVAALRTCFGPATRTQPWPMTLPVIDCPANNPSNCATVVGTVDIEVVWVSDKDATTDKEFKKELFPPSKMGDWSCPSTCGGSGVCCWANFVSHFNLQNVDGITATYAQKSIYFLPSCTVHKPTGGTGGNNFGVLAQYPVLVSEIQDR